MWSTASWQASWASDVRLSNNVIAPAGGDAGGSCEPSPGESGRWEADIGWAGADCPSMFQGSSFRDLGSNSIGLQKTAFLALTGSAWTHAPTKSAKVHLERRTVIVRAISLSEEGEELLRRVGELIAPLADNQKQQQRTLEEQQRTLGGQQRLLGGLVEDGARQQITKMLGEDYQRPLLARSLQDLALLLPEEAVHKSSQSKQVLLGPLEKATLASTSLVEAGVPARLLGSLQDGAGQVGWFRDDGTVNDSMLGRFIGTCPDAALKQTLGRLRRVLKLDKKDDRIQELLQCESAGILCLVAAAFPEAYLTGRPGVMPSDELEIDCRGRIDIAQNGDFAYIDVGEVKTMLDYATSVPQLGLRLGALKWFVCNACGAKVEGVRLVGRLFVSKHGTKEEFADASQRDRASVEWGFSLYLHRV
ncbi:hypothetical protein KFL_002980060 [Klebsormidium nitens]|uniref:Uncharacterized protein n=1 Tax=Klebsormidium nitens TaxID=105231 RepID=A0A1Y1I9E2_KLENI|nr:hypothetical protein KFL_002980060 [Klebsormidium nitens]|eukprot:GAQ86582.1 hypothetical protein KFL_002980060 [Klebsormidium nitens]